MSFGFGGFNDGHGHGNGNNGAPHTVVTNANVAAKQSAKPLPLSGTHHLVAWIDILRYDVS